MDELLLKQMPHSAEAEQSVLGSILIDSRCVAEVMTMLKPSDFYLTANRDIYETVCSMFNYSQVIDPVTILEKMRQNGVAKDNSTAYLAELMSVTPTAANVRHYARIVRDKALLRAIAETAADITAMVSSGNADAEQVLEAAEQKQPLDHFIDFYTRQNNQAAPDARRVAIMREIIEQAEAKLHETD